ncbi:MAG: peptidoglycan-binding protein [Acidimicrobiia bacterium]|nr:peptidoglycan-binding protein [Acidimicrobiia bacterium]
MSLQQVDKSATIRLDGGVTASPSPEEKSKKTWWLLGAAVIVAAAAIVWLSTRGDDTTSGDVSASIEFAEVVVADLTVTEEFAGTLGRVEADPVLTRKGGTVTATADAGSTLTQGDVLFEIDDEPVVLMLGGVPAYRTLAPEPESTTVVARGNGTLTAAASENAELESGDVLFTLDDRPVVLLEGTTPAYRTLRQDVDEGPDIEQLEAALASLGYDPDGTVTIDGDFTANTANMVERWQEAIGTEEDGVVDLGEIVFLSGTVTIESTIPDVGASVGPGQAILAVTVGAGDLEGNDVLQLETALAALGHSPGPVDGVYDAATTRAVIAWQESNGAEADGVVDIGEVVFLPDNIRVTDVVAAPGSPVNPGSPVLATSSSETVVTVALPAADQGTLSEGDVVTVVLPDNSRTVATVTSVGTVATQVQGGDATFEITITLDDPSAAAGLDEAPVDVEVITDSRPGAITVPVTSLIALAEGGYAVEVKTATGTEYIPVEPGLYSSGLVEITDGALQPGDRVVVP